MNWAFYSTLSRPLKQPATGQGWSARGGVPSPAGGLAETGKEELASLRSRPGILGLPEKPAGPSRGHPGQGLPLPWSRGGAGARPVRRGGPRCQGLRGGRERRLHWFDVAFASGDARFSPGWARRKSPECPRPLSAPPPTVWSGPFLQRKAWCIFHSSGLPPFAPTLSVGETKG